MIDYCQLNQHASISVIPYGFARTTGISSLVPTMQSAWIANCSESAVFSGTAP